MELDLALAASQGGGVNVKENGVANFENCNIHDNNADSVCLHLELSLNFHPWPRWNVTRSCFFYLQGGGLYIDGTATLTNTNVYSNEARYVRWPSALA